MIIAKKTGFILYITYIVILKTAILLEKGGTINISSVGDGIHINEEINITDGNININKLTEGIETKNSVINISGGNLNILSSDDALNAAVDITISGGVIVAVGSKQPECGIDSDASDPAITGGTVIAVGGGNSTPSTNTTTQSTVRMGVNSNSKVICLKDSSNNVIFTFNCDSNYTTLLYSSSKLKIGESYTLYGGGSINSNTDFNGYSEDSTYSDGTKLATYTQSSVVTIQGGSGGPEGGGNGNNNQSPFGGGRR